MTDNRLPYDAQPYDETLYAPGTVAAGGLCSWHGVDTCDNEPVVSFVDAQSRRQSGCVRAVHELVERGLMGTPRSRANAIASDPIG